MPLSLAEARRWSRQLALPEIGSEGQSRLATATAVIVGGDLVAETAAMYVAAAGIGALRLVGDGGDVERAVLPLRASLAIDRLALPTDGDGWLAALTGSGVLVRVGLDEDAGLAAAVRLGVPAVLARVRREGIDLLALRAHGPCPHRDLHVPARAADRDEDVGAAAVVAGALLAAEALWMLIGRADVARAVHLRLPLDGGEPLVQEIPWAPECFICGGTAAQAIFR